MRNREIGGSGVGATVWDWPIGRNHCNKTLKTFSKLLEGYALRVFIDPNRSLITPREFRLHPWAMLEACFEANTHPKTNKL